MQKVPSPSGNHIQIVDDGLARVPSIYSHQQAAAEKHSLSRWDTQEQEIEDEEDERDVKKKQV